MLNPVSRENKNTINTNPLPPILAGPIVRRAKPNKIYFWVCTSERLKLGIQVYQGRLNTSDVSVPVIDDPPLIGEGFGRTVQVGENVFVTLLKATPKPENSRFPQGEEISYEIYVLESPQKFSNAKLLLDKKERSLITIDSSENMSPSFCLQKSDYDDLRVAFGSCRKFHGDGEDMTVALFEQAYAKKEAAARPNGLFLLGDQIYADDVSDLTLIYINSISRKFFGYSELLPNPHYNPLNEQLVKEADGFSDLPSYQLDKLKVVVPKPYLIPQGKWINPYEVEIGGRQKVICDAADFTSTDGANHLATLAEYCTMHLLAFNDKMWDYARSQQAVKNSAAPPSPERLETPTTYIAATPGGALSLDALLDKAKAGSEAMRRILANTPTYMICDDHEITDDWNITSEWKRRVFNNPLGRRIVTNGLCAFWMFQGWGNDPIPNDTTTTLFEGHAATLLAKSFDTTSEKTIMDNCSKELRWTFVAPTTPPSVFLDTRFNRENTPLDYILWENKKGKLSFNSPVLSYKFYNQKSDDLLKIEDCIAPVLINRNQIAHIKKILSKYKHDKGIIIATPTPIFGLTSLENSIRWLIDLEFEAMKLMKQGGESFLSLSDLKGIFMDNDAESWSINPYSIDNFVGLLEELYPEIALGTTKDIHIKILSGDVHYSFHKIVEFYTKSMGNKMMISMTTSSAIKNPPVGMKGLAAKASFSRDKEIDQDFFERRKLDGSKNSESNKLLVYSCDGDYDSSSYSLFSHIEPMYCYKDKSKKGLFDLNGSFGYLMGLPYVYFIL